MSKKVLKKVEGTGSFGYNNSSGDATYHVVGSPVDFYIFYGQCEELYMPWSRSITSNVSLYNELKKCFHKQNSDAFITKCTELFQEHKSLWKFPRD